MNLTTLAFAITFAGGLFAGFGAAWTLRTHAIEKMQLEAKDERINQQRAARVTLERTLETQQRAQADATARAIVLRRSADAARSELVSLRQSTQALVRSIADNPASCPERISTASDVLTECAAKLTELGAKADRHVSDIKTLTEAWPQ